MRQMSKAHSFIFVRVISDTSNASWRVVLEIRKPKGQFALKFCQYRAAKYGSAKFRSAMYTFADLARCRPVDSAPSVITLKCEGSDVHFDLVILHQLLAEALALLPQDLVYLSEKWAVMFRAGAL